MEIPDRFRHPSFSTFQGPPVLPGDTLTWTALRHLGKSCCVARFVVDLNYDLMQSKK